MMGNPELQKELNLSAVQKTKIQAIQEKYRTKMRAIFGGGRPGGQGQGNGSGQGRPPMDPAKVKQFQALREAQMKEVNGVLNSKQQAILKKWIAAHPPRFGGPGRPGGGKPGGGKPGGSGHNA